ncbi:MAG: metal-sulfur cluster assembly factor [Ramlibacter sp.]
MSGLRFPYEGPQPLGETVLAALRQVVDPEMNIVDVGLVVGVALQDKELNVQVTMTSAACPVADVIVGDIERQLDLALPPDLFIRVELVWEPPWSPDHLSEAGRRSMGW